MPCLNPNRFSFALALERFLHTISRYLRCVQHCETARRAVSKLYAPCSCITEYKYTKYARATLRHIHMRPVHASNRVLASRIACNECNVYAHRHRSQHFLCIFTLKSWPFCLSSQARAAFNKRVVKFYAGVVETSARMLCAQFFGGGSRCAGTSVVMFVCGAHTCCCCCCCCETTACLLVSMFTWAGSTGASDADGERLGGGRRRQQNDAQADGTQRFPGGDGESWS